jgi:hypothetical protein
MEAFTSNNYKSTRVSAQLNYLIGKDSEHRLRKGGCIISQKIKFFITTAVRC